MKGKVRDYSKPGRTNLAERMRSLAKERDDLPENWVDLADEFDEATVGFYADPPTKTVQQFLGCFARARKVWCEVTGEPLV